MTAKTPLKVHLRLRSGKREKAPHCGALWPGCGRLRLRPFICAKIERPPPLEKPSCKVWLFAQDRSREYRQKVTATTPSQTAFHRVFQLLAQTAHVCFHSRKRVHTRLSEKNRTQGHTRRNRGVLDGGGITTLGSFCADRKPCVARGVERQTLPLLGLGRGCSQRTQKAFGTAMRSCASLFRGVAAPLGCVVFFRF